MEGVTQGDNTAMGMYSISTMPIIVSTAIAANPISLEAEEYKADETGEDQAETKVDQIWYADDAAGAGKLDGLKRWWDQLCLTAPNFGYFPKPSKTWVIVKEGCEERARQMFPNLQVTFVGQRYLGSFIGTAEGKEKFVGEKVKEWCADLRQLAEIATREPQAAYSAFIFGLSKRWNYVCRTTPDINHLLRLLEHEIKETFIPALFDRAFSCEDTLRNIMALPQRYGGLGIPNMLEVAENEYLFSLQITQTLTEAICEQQNEFVEDAKKTKEIKADVVRKRNLLYKKRQQDILEELGEAGKLMVNLASEKGASSWLTSLPLKEFGYLLNRQQFNDALCLRYNLNLKDCPKTCACGNPYSANHALICKKGGYVSMRHNGLRDTLAGVMRGAGCKDVQVEPQLLPTNNCQLPRSTIITDEARLDISARSVWNVLERAFFDVRVFHALAPSNASKPIKQMYLAHENEKKRAYNARVLEVEKGTFTPLVFSTSGGMGQEAHKLVKKLAERIESRTGQRYADAVGHIRRRLRFQLLKTTVIALRGERGSKKVEIDNIEDLDLNLEPRGSGML